MSKASSWVLGLVAFVALGFAAWSLVQVDQSPAAWPIGAFADFSPDTPVQVVVGHGYFDPTTPEGQSPAGVPAPSQSHGVTRILVVNVHGTEPVALLDVSPWLGCRVVIATRDDALAYSDTPPDDFEVGFLDPCHGGLFSLTGEHLAGPGSRGLSRFPVGIAADGTLLLDLTHLMPGIP